jgi:hypothetical protein
MVDAGSSAPQLGRPSSFHDRPCVLLPGLQVPGVARNADVTWSRAPMDGLGAVGVSEALAYAAYIRSMPAAVLSAGCGTDCVGVHYCGLFSGA